MTSFLRGPGGPREIIDLTGDDDDDDGDAVSKRHPQVLAPPAYFPPAPQEVGPPRKRPKIAENHQHDLDHFKDAFRSCLQRQISPYIEEVVNQIGDPNVNKHKVSLEVLTRIANAELLKLFREHNNSIPKDYERAILQRVPGQVRELAQLPAYRIKSPLGSSYGLSPIQPDENQIHNVARNGRSDIETNGDAKYPTATKTPLAQQSEQLVNAYANGLVSSSSSRATASPSTPPRPIVTQRSLAEILEPNEQCQSVSAGPSAELPPAQHKQEAHIEAAKANGEPRPSPAAPTQSPPRTPAAPPRSRKPTAVATTPRNFRSRARAQALRSVTGVRPGDAQHDKWFEVERRPYIKGGRRQEVLHRSGGLAKVANDALKKPLVLHVDFTPHEIRSLLEVVERALGDTPPVEGEEPLRRLARMLKQHRHSLPTVLERLAASKRELVAEKKRRALANDADSEDDIDSEDSEDNYDEDHIVRGREAADIANFISDLISHSTSLTPHALTYGRDDLDKHDAISRGSSLSSLLLAREISGQNGFLSPRHWANYPNEFKKYREDGLERKGEWAGGAGDVSTITWVSNEVFICGTTAHSDPHNQQYNKPGNLLLGSTALGTLRSDPGHRIVRPIVDKGENATEAMRETQDPWLYSSVVSSDYDPIHDRAYTSSYDHTVKAWKVDKSGASMTLLGTWRHDGVVNFVEVSRYHSGIVATAAEVPVGAVRIYNVNEDDISNSPYHSFSCSRVLDLEGNPVVTDKWAYTPATMKWGLVKEVGNLLLVGYSPRSFTGDDNDIPEDKRNTGEICLWDGLTGRRVRVTSASAQNVFEVLWHPSQPCFIVATSPLKVASFEDRVRTQIRVFRPSDNPDLGHAFSEVQTLDCEALDINELTIMPNSFSYSYITAGCTDGKVYVWDTARGDKPIHVLKHGEPHEDVLGDREVEDVGVKFTAWGTTPDRFYTGSSDGVVKVWNVRSERKPLLRDLLEVPAQVSFGTFSPDKSKLLIGDATGRTFLLSVDDDVNVPARSVKIPTPNGLKAMRAPVPVIPHPQPPAPTHDAEGNVIMRELGPTDPEFLLKSGRIVILPDRTVGAVQGPRYAETGLFRRELHIDMDPEKGLISPHAAKQQGVVKMHAGTRRASRSSDLQLPEVPDASHEKSPSPDATERAREEVSRFLKSLDPETEHALRQEGADLDPDPVVPHPFVYDRENDYVPGGVGAEEEDANDEEAVLGMLYADKLRFA